MPDAIVARSESAWKADIISRRKLTYTTPLDPNLGCPRHVRSASGIVTCGDGWLVVQDDANFLAKVSATTVAPVPLPLRNGFRLFDKATGGKKNKWDLEAITSIDGAFYAFGSGSTPNREVVLRVTGDLANPEVQIRDAADWYGTLSTWLAGAELNIEGVNPWGGQLWVAQRGNGAPTAVDALWSFAVADFLSWFEGGKPPEISSATTVDLGKVDGVRLTMTDLTSSANERFFVAAAEDSPDAVQDGPVVGAAIGILDAENSRWTRIYEEGKPSLDKFEGIAQDSDDPALFWLVTDADDPDVAADLCSVRFTRT